MQGENQYDSQRIEPQAHTEPAPAANGQHEDDVIEVVTVIKSCAYDPLTRL